MSILDTIRTQVVRLIQGDRPLPPDTAYANIWPVWEQQTPQYPIPNAYNLAQTGYRRDELVFACIDYRAQTINEPPLMLYTGRKKQKRELGGVFDSFPGGRPNSEMGEAEFWAATEIYRLIAGTAVWEIEFNRIGEPIAVWPLNPAYCSFLRGPQSPLRAVRYLYPGLDPVDIPRERLIVLQEFDPIYPMLKGLSRTAVALRSINVHAGTTDFLNLFFQRGAMIQGYLKFAQSLNENEAKRARERWAESHGGARNWSVNNIGVLGQGADYVPTQMNFRDMGFADIDGRTESLICMVMQVSPILLHAKVGLGASTYSNYEQASESYYQIVARPSWRWYAGEITQQLVPYLPGYRDGVYAAHDLSEISALQDDVDAVWKRGIEAAKSNLITRDMFLRMVGEDPIDGGEPVFVGVQIGAADAPASPVTNTEADLADQQAEQAAEAERQHELDLAKAENPAPSPFSQPTEKPAEKPEPGEQQMKAWHRAALASPGAGVGAPFDDELLACKSRNDVRRVFERHWPRPDTLAQAVAELKRYNDALTIA